MKYWQNKFKLTLIMNGMQIHFYAADTQDTSIIAYGDAGESRKKFKIHYLSKQERYESWIKLGRSYFAIGFSSSLEDSQKLCRKEILKHTLN